MASYRGKFQYLSQNGSVTQQGACQLQFDDETFTLMPEPGAPLVSDLGDVDAVIAADYEIQLPLYTGNTLKLQQFGKSYESLSRELLESYRKRTLECLLLEDMEEVDRFTGGFTLETLGAQPASGASGAALSPDDGSPPAAERQQERTEKTKRKGVPAIPSRAAGVCAQDHANAHGSAGPECRFASFQNQK